MFHKWKLLYFVHKILLKKCIYNCKNVYLYSNQIEVKCRYTYLIVIIYIQLFSGSSTLQISLHGNRIALNRSGEEETYSVSLRKSSKGCPLGIVHTTRIYVLRNLRLLCIVTGEFRVWQKGKKNSTRFLTNF